MKGSAIQQYLDFSNSPILKSLYFTEHKSTFGNFCCTVSGVNLY